LSVTTRVNVALLSIFSIVAVTIFGLQPARLSAQDTEEVRIIYYGKVTSFQELEDAKLATFCADHVTPELQKRGYFDLDKDEIFCYNTKVEAESRMAVNRQIRDSIPAGKPDIVPAPHDTTAFSDSLGMSNFMMAGGMIPLLKPLTPETAGYHCSTNRAALYDSAIFINWNTDACSSNSHAHMADNNGQPGLGSIYMDGGVSCITIYEGPPGSQSQWSTSSTYYTVGGYTQSSATDVYWNGAYSC